MKEIVKASNLPAISRITKLGDYFEVESIKREGIERQQYDSWMYRLNQFIREAKRKGYNVTSGQQEGFETPFTIVFKKRKMIEDKSTTVDLIGSKVEKNKMEIKAIGYKIERDNKQSG